MDKYRNMGGGLSIETARLPRWREMITISTDIQIDQAELERRLADYISTAEFQQSIEALADYYRAMRLPVPPYEVLRCGEVQEVRKCLESLMTCEAQGHPRKEKANPENGAGTLTSRRCGAEEHLRW